MIKHNQGEQMKMFTYHRRFKNPLSSPGHFGHDVTNEHQTNCETNYGDNDYCTVLSLCKVGVQ
jgi:hypothetical protein